MQIRFLFQFRLQLSLSLLSFPRLQITSTIIRESKDPRTTPTGNLFSTTTTALTTNYQQTFILNMHGTCPKCSAAVAGGSKTCSSCGSVGYSVSCLTTTNSYLRCFAERGSYRSIVELTLYLTCFFCHIELPQLSPPPARMHVSR